MYVPFGGFEDWAKVVVDDERWGRVVGHSAELRADAVGFDWLEGPLRASAYQSGAIEGMHPGDRGLTVTLMEAIATDWAAAVRDSADGGGADVVAHVQAGTDALHLALDVATTATAISEAWIRHLHEVACAAQPTYLVNTPSGERQRRPLLLGAYKASENHVTLVDGSMLEFAPVVDVGPEMARLVSDLQSPAFDAVPPVVQAAFAHQALTHIHPFADGNGRVARVLASVFLLRTISLPVFLFADEKEGYLDALAAADRGRIADFVEFILRRSEDLAALLVERRRARDSQPLNAEWRSTIDAAAQFASAVDRAISRAEARYRIRPDRLEEPRIDLEDPDIRSISPGDLPRFPESVRNLAISLGGLRAEESIKSKIDLASTSSRPFGLETYPYGHRFDARIDEVWPRVSAAFDLRLDAWLDQVVAELVKRVANG
jgi:Fic family protein